VVDLGQGLAAPHCGLLLALGGADVIKVEPPEGDWSRRLGTIYGDMSAMAAFYNRGKRGLALDLKSTRGRDLAMALARDADVFIESFRPGVIARLGLGYAALAAENPRLVYLSVSGFGQEGPYADRPCSDSVAQAFGGIMALNVGIDGMPHRVGAIVADHVTGLYAMGAVAGALLARARTGRGRHIDVSLAQGVAALLGHKLAEHVLEGGAPRQLNVPAGAYRTSDGWFMLTLVKEAHFAELAAALERPDLAADPRFATFALRSDHADALYAALRPIFLADTTAAWLERLRAADLLCDRINGPLQWLEDPHNRAVEAALSMAQPGMGAIPHPRTPGLPVDWERALSPAPAIGEHSRAVLAGLGLAPAEIDRLVDEGVVGIAR
jgi:crotonobetainyl-CoA:carnitine CoA-transferase CaiB-like acyl-CoA transferase